MCTIGTICLPSPIDRVEASGAPRVPARDVIVVGDTVLDVACAKAAGARSVAVATGPSDVEVLAAERRRCRVEDSQRDRRVQLRLRWAATDSDRRATTLSEKCADEADEGPAPDGRREVGLNPRSVERLRRVDPSEIPQE